MAASPCWLAKSYLEPGRGHQEGGRPSRSGRGAHIQTNGVGLDRAYLRLFTDSACGSGSASTAGRREHDRHRRFANGRGSYAAVTGRAPTAPAAGVQAPVRRACCARSTLHNDPVASYRGCSPLSRRGSTSCCRTEPGTLRRPGGTGNRGHTPYGEWLIAVFDRGTRTRGPVSGSSRRSSACC